MKKIISIFVVLCCLLDLKGKVVDTLRLDVFKAIVLARKQSPDILVARHSFRSSYWNYCYYKANYKPTLSFSSTPYYDNQINIINLENGTSKYVSQKQLRTDANLSITQNIPWTGGTVSVNTSLQRLDMLGDNKYHTYKTNPVTITLQQSIFGYNSLKWDKKIEPLLFEEAKKNYVEALELVSVNAVSKFFNLAQAQSDLQTSQTNYANADTLYIFAQGRYNIGTIAENEMLQLEINRLTEESNMSNAVLEVENTQETLRTYLGITDEVYILTEVNHTLPNLLIDLDQALALSITNSPDIINMERRKQSSDSSVAYAKSQTGLKADIYAQVGLTQTNSSFNKVYKDPQNQQYIELGIKVPILDWGRSKGRVSVAKSNRDMVYTQVEQDRINFELNVKKIVNQFNLQYGRVKIATKTDFTANKRNDIARKLYLLGRSTILDMNAAISEQNAARRNYISTIYNYWLLYYTIRSMTLYDFLGRVELSEDYQSLLK